MKKLVIICWACLLSLAAQAQDYAVYNDFMQKYMNMNMGYYEADKSAPNGFRVVEQVGKPVPEYYLNKKYNSKTLRGKYVIMDFWATWCGGCRVLSHYMDSLMLKTSDQYGEDWIQLIGMNYKENMVDKGYNADKYWKEKGYSFPNVRSKGVTACGDTLHAGHPTAIIIDDKGIIRYRVDGAGPATAGQLMFALWALKTLPESGLPMNLETAKQFLAEGKETEALYVLWHLPAGEEVDVLKFRYAAKENPWVAQGLYKELDARYKGTEAYQTIMRRVAEIILKENLSDFYYNAWQTLKYFSDHGQWGRENSDEIQLLIGLLQHRYASSLQRSAAFRLKSSKGTLTNEVLQKEFESILNSQPDKQ